MIRAVESKINKINKLQNDKTKVIEWNKLNNSKQDYIIIDKKHCSAIVYTPSGKEVETFEVGLGETVGDCLNNSWGNGSRKIHTTPAGEYSIETEKMQDTNEYEQNIFSIGNDYTDPNVNSHLSLYEIPLPTLSYNYLYLAMET